ncbi:MAG: hypothetical protein A3H27_12055 [Acidobacteria bacterium RIFCSPLOWO2_02_FULL_59_13]|nr:MAG: hypothetical protein A3H27_12055 [Acidobacteria bacterium RIFCSPLOWO2_02_FULL_59_13]
MRLRPVLYGLLALPLMAALLLSWGAGGVHAADNEMKVFRDITCGCCMKWVEHLRANGFQVTVQDVPETNEYSRQHGVPDALRSCHVGIIAGYAIEGHVPAADIHRLLKERPAAKGLAAPGMPAGSPGMEVAGGRRDRYSVMLFDAKGRASVYQEYPAISPR